MQPWKRCSWMLPSLLAITHITRCNFLMGPGAALTPCTGMCSSMCKWQGPSLWTCLIYSWPDPLGLCSWCWTELDSLGGSSTLWRSLGLLNLPWGQFDKGENRPRDGESLSSGHISLGLDALPGERGWIKPGAHGYSMVSFFTLCPSMTSWIWALAF